MMKYKLMFGLMICMALIAVPLVSAEDISTFKKDQLSNLFQICDTCTYVTLDSIELPTKQLVNLNGSMVKDGNSFYYNYTFSNIGDGHYNVCGDKDGSLQCESIPYTVTGSGVTGTVGFYVIILLLTLGIVVIGYKVEDPWVIILGAFGMFLFGLYILFFGIAEWRIQFILGVLE